VHARYEDVLVVRPVEDPDHPAGRNLAVNAPEEVVMQLRIGRLLEARDGAPLRVDRREDFPDRAILSRRVAPLEHDEQCAAAVGVEHALQIGDARRVLGAQPLELVLALAVAGHTGMRVAQLDVLFGLDRLELHDRVGLMGNGSGMGAGRRATRWSRSEREGKEGGTLTQRR
jgi:hypothetical protein